MGTEFSVSDFTWQDWKNFPKSNFRALHIATFVSSSLPLSLFWKKLKTKNMFSGQMNWVWVACQISSSIQRPSVPHPQFQNLERSEPTLYLTLMVATPNLNSSGATYSCCHLSINFHMCLWGSIRDWILGGAAQTLLGVLGHSFLKILNSGGGKKG